MGNSKFRKLDENCILVVTTDTINISKFGTQVPKCLQHERLFNAGPRHQDVLHGPAQPRQNFFTLQAQAIVGFSSCREVTCYPEILLISCRFAQNNNFVLDNL